MQVILHTSNHLMYMSRLNFTEVRCNKDSNWQPCRWSARDPIPFFIFLGIHYILQCLIDFTAQVPEASLPVRKEPVESEDHCESTSSLEIDLQDISEPSKTPPMHSMEMNGPASSRGRSSEGSCEANQNGVAAPHGGATAASRFVSTRQGANTTQTRSVHQPTSIGANASARFIPSGANKSFNSNIAQRALHHNEMSLTNEPRLNSLDATISEVGLPDLQQQSQRPTAVQQQGQGSQAAVAVGGHYEGPSSLRGPSMEDGARNPIRAVATQGGAHDVNKLACSNAHSSVPMDSSNQVHPDQHHSNKWSMPRTVNKDGDVILGRHSLGTNVAKNSSAGTQTVSSDDEGKHMSVSGWVPPPLNSTGGRQSLLNQSVSTSTQTQPSGDDEGRMLSRQQWNAPPCMLSGNFHSGGNLPNQSVEKAPSKAQSDLDRDYKQTSGTYQKLVEDPQGEMALASGNKGGFQKMDQQGEIYSTMNLLNGRKVCVWSIQHKHATFCFRLLSVRRVVALLHS